MLYKSGKYAGAYIGEKGQLLLGLNIKYFFPQCWIWNEKIPVNVCTGNIKFLRLECYIRFIAGLCSRWFPSYEIRTTEKIGGNE